MADAKDDESEDLETTYKRDKAKSQKDRRP